MARYPRPTKQFTFIGRNFNEIQSTQKSLLRRTIFNGTTFPDGSGAGADDDAAVEIPKPIKDLVVDWEKADGMEIEAPVYVIFELPDTALLRFKITDDHHFEFYSNTRNLLDVSGKIEVE